MKEREEMRGGKKVRVLERPLTLDELQAQVAEMHSQVKELKNALANLAADKPVRP